MAPYLNKASTRHKPWLREETVLCIPPRRNKWISRWLHLNSGVWSTLGHHWLLESSGSPAKPRRATLAAPGNSHSGHCVHRAFLPPLGPRRDDPCPVAGLSRALRKARRVKFPNSASAVAPCRLDELRIVHCWRRQPSPTIVKPHGGPEEDAGKPAPDPPRKSSASRGWRDGTRASEFPG